MRPTLLARRNNTRPVLVLTRETSRPWMTRVTIAPITSRIRGLSVEVPVGVRNGLDHECVVNLDNIVTPPVTALGRQVGQLFDDQEVTLATALGAAFDLADPI